ncbi:EAL domain-containing protein [uncultured Massilia sp.]|uniref:sensor domain-containing protein n=1 Tax=uncultured Massilia sp. TaxID=169973 RepID=UPI0025D81392|nr:EAL domain-containing protein [uncultured Massilia sp.]
MTPNAENSDLMYRLLVQGVVDYAIYMLTPDGIVASWNAGAERAKGYAADEIVGRHYSTFYAPQDVAAGIPDVNLETARRSGRFEDHGWRLRKDGSAFWAHVVIDAIRKEDGTLLGFAKITRDCSAERAAEQARREQEQRFRHLVQGVTDYAIYMLDTDGHVVNWNAGAQRAKGYTADEIVGRHFSVFYRDEERAAGMPQAALETARREHRFEAEGWRVRKDGSTFWTSVVIDAVHDDDGRLIGFAKITRDITERRQQELRLLDAKELAEKYGQQAAALSRFLDSVIANIPAGVLALDGAQRILLANQHAQRLFGGGRAIAPGAPLSCLGAAAAAYVGRQVAGVGPGSEMRLDESEVETALGTRTLRCRAVYGSRPDGEGDYTLVIAEDVTEELAAYARIHHMAQHDGLTDLPNRAFFHDRLEAAIAADQAQRAITAILCLDLDNFKNINDALGHAYGDKLLLALAKRLKKYLREQDTLARLGGDEFAVVLPGLKRLDEARAAAQRLIDAVGQAFQIDDHSFSVGLSVGIASTNSGATAEHLLRFGDMALYEAKRNGRNRYEVFRPELEEASRIRRQMETDMRRALHLGQIEMVYQPIIEKDCRIAGYEALMRWNHPERGQIVPLDFIPLAEETGLINDLGARALNLACQEAAGWTNGETVAVNLSPVQFKNRELVATVALALADSGLAPHRLELEITESVLLDDSDANIRTLRALKALGVAISLDDFGTGYSSLSYLRSFPFDKIKIDKSFVQDIGSSREALAIIRAITGLSNSLLIHTTAEGVETPEQFLRLQEEGCSHFQGYLFGRPESSHRRLQEVGDIPGLRD